MEKSVIRGAPTDADSPLRPHPVRADPRAAEFIERAKDRCVLQTCFLDSLSI
jgi:hypothetical protein